MLFVRPHLSLLLLLGLPIPATATLADRVIVSTVGFGDPSIIPPRTSSRQLARASSRFFRDYETLTLVRLR